MPQMQLPLFPAGVTEIDNRIAVQKEAGTVYYIHGHLPVLQYAEDNVRAFGGPCGQDPGARTASGEETRAVLRQIFDTEADLIPDPVSNTLSVSLHHRTLAAHDQATEHLLAELNATQTISPGTRLTLVFKIGSP